MITRRRVIIAGGAAALARATPSLAQSKSKPVRIGILEDMSGPFADLGGPGSFVAARMAIDDFGGNVIGRPIEVLSGDHQNKPDIGGQIARSWYDLNDVRMITGLTNSAVALGIQKLTAEKNRINIVVTAALDRLIEEDCSPNGILWNYTGRAIVKSTIEQAIKTTENIWFFITSNYAGGRTMEEQATPLIQAAGGKILGTVHPPVGSSDFSSYLLQAQASGAKNLGVMTFGQDFITLMKQAAEFNIMKDMRPIAPFVFHSDLHSIGIAASQGMIVAAPFYWDLNEATRAFSIRFTKETGRPPDMAHGGVYTAITHYLKSIQAAGTDESAVVLMSMRKMPVNDMYTEGASIRADGMVVRPIYLFVVKSPSESTSDWDMLRQTGVVDKDLAFSLPADQKCPLLKM